MTVVVDAGAMIALLDDQDAHHPAAWGVFIRSGEDAFLTHPVNLAEALVRYAQDGHEAAIEWRLHLLGVEMVTLGEREARTLASLRARTRLKMPDVCALATAMIHDVPLITFDRRLAAAADRLDLRHPASIGVKP